MLENSLQEHQREVEKRLNELQRSMAAMESRKKKNEHSINAWMNKAIVLAGIICGSWIIVTILQLLK